VFDERWATRRVHRRVLAVMHNVTAATRLFDVLPLVATDERVQVVFSCPGSSGFTDGTVEFLTERQVAVIPWEQALMAPFDLAIAASHGGSLERLTCPLVIVPHGMGHNKYLRPGNRKPETGCRFSVCRRNGCCTTER
jgi:hypothetical protein